MRHIFMMATLSLIGFSGFATTIAPSQVQLSPSEIDQVVRLVHKSPPAGPEKKLQILVTDAGHSTDVSPRYSVYLGYSSFAEMGNITADFKLTDRAFEFKKASRKGPGIYEVQVIEYRDGGFYDVTLNIDATALFAEEIKTRKECGGEFCDTTLKSNLLVTETATKIEATVH